MKKYGKLIWIFLFITLGIIVYSAIMLLVMYFNDESENNISTELNEGWYTDQGGSYEEVTFPYYFSLDENETSFSMSIELDNVFTDNMSLYLILYYYNVEIILDGEKMDFNEFNNTFFEKTDGITSDFFLIPGNVSGHTITLVFTPEIELDEYIIYTPALCHQEEMQKIIYHRSQPTIALIIIIEVISAVILFIAFYFGKYITDRCVACFLSIYAIIVGINCFSKLEWVHITSSDTTILYIIFNITYLIIFMPVFAALYNSLVGAGKKISSIFLSILICNSTIQIAVYIFTRYEFAHMEIITNYLILIGTIVSILLLIFGKFINEERKKEILYSFTPVILGAVLDMILHIVLSVFMEFDFILIGAGIMILFQLYTMAKKAAKVYNSNKESIFYQRIAYTDILTQIKNRNAYEKEYDEINLKFVESDKINIAVAIDLNNLKGINDTYGHHVGDMMVKEMAKYLKDEFGDTIGIYRMGGDEFLILVEGTSENEIIEKIEKIAEKTKSQPYYQELTISFSYGISIFDSKEHENLKGLLKEADQKMYQKKVEYYQTVGERRKDRN